MRYAILLFFIGAAWTLEMDSVPGLPTTVPVTAPSEIADQEAITKHLAALESKIDQLERRMGRGSGAYRKGSSFLVEGGGSESVLERLRRLERELGQARGEIATRDATLAEIRTRADNEKKRAENLAEKADGLGHVRDNLVAAQQTLAERQTIIDQLNQRLAEADLARLKGEKAYFQLAAAVLRLVPGQSQDLMDVQEQIRQQAKVLQPAEPVRKTVGDTGRSAKGTP